MLKREHKVSNISSEAIFAIPAMKPSRVIFASIFCLLLMIIDIRYESGSYIRSFSNDLLKPITFLTRFPLQIYENFNLFFSSRVNLERKIQSLEEENLNSISSRGQFNRTLPNLQESTQALIETLNYGIAILLLLFVWWVFRRNERHRKEIYQERLGELGQE